MDSHKSDSLFIAWECQSMERIRKAATTLKELGSRQSVESYILTCVDLKREPLRGYNGIHSSLGLSPCGQACCALSVGMRWIQRREDCVHMCVCVCIVYCTLLNLFVDQAALAVRFCGDFCDPRINRLMGSVFNPWIRRQSCVWMVSVFVWKNCICLRKTLF